MSGNGLMFRIMAPDNPQSVEGKTTAAAVPGRPASVGDGDATSGPEPAGSTQAGREGEVGVDGRGRSWWARVVGRSGRAHGGAPLLLLGFRGDGDAAPTLEALVPGRVLEEIPREVLESALARAVEPVPMGRRKPFFEDAGDARRT